MSTIKPIFYLRVENRKLVRKSIRLVFLSSHICR